MSATDTAEPSVHPAPVEDAEGSPYNRDGDWHYWQRDEDGTPVPPEDERPKTGHADLEGTDKWSLAAHGVLKDNAPLLCPFALDRDGEKHELGEAYAFPPRSDGSTDIDYEYRFEPRPYRVNENSGDIVSGPIIGNRPIEEFQIDVWAVLEGAVTPADGISYSTAFEVWDRSMEMKRDGGPHDQTIMAKVAAWISNPRLLEFEE